MTNPGASDEAMLWVITVGLAALIAPTAVQALALVALALYYVWCRLARNVRKPQVSRPTV